MLNWAHVHLILNHIPIFRMLFGAALLLVAVVRKNDVLNRAGLATLVIAAVLTVPVYLTGEEAEEVVEHLGGVSEETIEEHEEFGLVSLIGIEAAGLVSLIALWVSRKRATPPPVVVGFALVAVIVSLMLVAWTAHLGGQIRHQETRPGFQVPSESEPDRD